jgi:hypothetical protein
MVMGYRDADSGAWVVEPEGDGLWEEITGTRTGGGSD